MGRFLGAGSHLLPVLTLALVVAAACDRGGPTDASPPDAPLVPSANGASARTGLRTSLQPREDPTTPIHGEFTWTFDGWSIPAPGRCPEAGGPWILSTGTGTGTVSHLGRVQASGGYCLNPATFAFVNGEVTFIAANGDRLLGNYDGQGFPGASPNEAGWTDVLEFTGRDGPVRRREWHRHGVRRRDHDVRSGHRTLHWR